MNNVVYQFLDEAGTQEFINVILEIANENFENCIVNEVTNSPNQVMTAPTVLSIIDEIFSIIDRVKTEKESVDSEVVKLREAVDAVGVLNHLNVQFITGDISTIVQDPRPNVLYFQHDNEDDITWAMYINNGSWKCVGETKYDLLNYWCKDNIDEFRRFFYEKAMGTISDEDIRHKTAMQFNKVINE